MADGCRRRYVGKMKTIDNCVFPKIGVPQNGWFNGKSLSPIQMDDLGGKPTIFGNIQLCVYLCVLASLMFFCRLTFFSPRFEDGKKPRKLSPIEIQTPPVKIFGPQNQPTPLLSSYLDVYSVRTTFWLVQNPVNTGSNGGLLVVLDTGNPEQPWTEPL